MQPGKAGVVPELKARLRWVKPRGYVSPAGAWAKETFASRTALHCTAVRCGAVLAPCEQETHWKFRARLARDAASGPTAATRSGRNPYSPCGLRHH